MWEWDSLLYISRCNYDNGKLAAENAYSWWFLIDQNPNGTTCDQYEGFRIRKFFVGMHPIYCGSPWTVGELAQRWSMGKNGFKRGSSSWSWWIPVWQMGHTIPAITSDKSLLQIFQMIIKSGFTLVPAFLKARSVSLGRGTLFQFQTYGYSRSSFGKFTFTPNFDKWHVQTHHHFKISSLLWRWTENESLNQQFTLTNTCWMPLPKIVEKERLFSNNYSINPRWNWIQWRRWFIEGKNCFRIEAPGNQTLILIEVEREIFNL